MIPRERVIAALHGQSTDRPLFCPAIYEHKAKLVDSSPSQVAQNSDLLARAVLAEHDIYGPDILTVGIDVYNIESEALGCKVGFPETLEAVPAIEKRAISDVADIDKLSTVDPERSGRMPLMLEAAQHIHKRIGNDVFVRGALTGPFSMGAELVGIEQLLIATMTQTDETSKLLKFCCDVAIDYGKAFLARGLGVAIFDSQTAPPLVSPEIYGRAILPQTQRLISSLKEADATFVEYIVGGDTGRNAANIFATGADIVLSDFASDVSVFLDYTKRQGQNVLLRRNLSPVLIESGSEEQIVQQTRDVARLAKANRQLIVGTGVLSYNTPVERILLVRNTCMEQFED